MNLVTCGNCGWVHMGVTLAHAFGETKRFVDWWMEQDGEVQASYGTVSYPKVLFQYLFCQQCGVDCTWMREFQDGDCPDGVTIGPIVAHGDLVLDGAEKDDLQIQHHLLERARGLLTGIARNKIPDVSSARYWLAEYDKHVD